MEDALALFHSPRARVSLPWPDLRRDEANPLVLLIITWDSRPFLGDSASAPSLLKTSGGGAAARLARFAPSPNIQA